jgi:putative sugar O-methyltransferase
MATTRQAELFEQMRESYALVEELGLPNIKSEYWRSLLSEGRQGEGGKGNFIERDELWLDFRRNVITKGLDNANVPDERLPAIHEKWKRMYERLAGTVPDRFQRFLQESPIGNPRALEIDGIQITQSSIEYTYMLAHLDRYLAGVETVVDIGGGYGGLARLIKLAHPEVKLVLFDLPEINTIQTYFLGNAFPDATVLGLRDVAHQNVIDPREIDVDFLVLPGQLIDKLRPGSFQLAINTRSMMEMDLETVSHYVGEIQDKLAVGGAFFCINRYEKKTRLKDYPFDERWYVSYSEPWPTVIDGNPHHELIAIRTQFPVIGGLKEHVAAFPPFEGAMGRVRAKLKAVLS